MTRTATLTCVFLLMVATSSGLAAEEQDAVAADRALPGVELARTLATATGIAITPLLGVGAVGAAQYYRTPEAERAELPWFAMPWFWLPALLIVACLLLKEPILGWVPVAKKPVDALEVVESKASALLAAPAIVPMFVSALSGVAAARSVAAFEPALGAVPAAMALFQGPSGVFGWLLTGLAVLVFLVAFFCVWLAFHAINVLILLSPFGVLDIFLRLVKLGVLTVLVGATLLHPYFGVAVALFIVLVSIPMAAWSFRLSVFGGTLAWDLVTLRHRRTAPIDREVVAFTAQGIGGLPNRVRGRLRCDPQAGGLFVYRRALIGPRRELSVAPGALILSRGLLCPLVEGGESENAELETLFRLAPRYRSQEEDLARSWGLPPARDGQITRGFRAAIAWLREMSGRGSKLVGSKLDDWTVQAPGNPVTLRD